MVRKLSTTFAALAILIVSHSSAAHAVERLVSVNSTEVSGIGTNCEGPAPFIVSFGTKKISKSGISVSLNGKTRRVARGKATRFVAKKIDGEIGRQFTTTIHPKRGVQVSEVAINLTTGASCKFSFNSGRIG